MVQLLQEFDLDGCFASISHVKRQMLESRTERAHLLKVETVSSIMRRKRLRWYEHVY